MFCYFAGGKMALASPGSNITGVFSSATSPDNYTIKNLTKFAKTTYSTADFDNAVSDAMLFYGFDTDQLSDKAGDLAINDVYAFGTQSGLTGIFKVLEGNGNASGTLKIAIKIQKEISAGKSFEIYAY